MKYQIQVLGKLDQSWAGWLGDLQIHSWVAADGSTLTTLSGDFADQPALFGALDGIRDLNLELISVARVDKAG